VENLDKELVSASARISMSNEWRKRDPINQRLRTEQSLEKINKAIKYIIRIVNRIIIEMGEVTWCLRVKRKVKG